MHFLKRFSWYWWLMFPEPKNIADIYSSALFFFFFSRFDKPSGPIYCWIIQIDEACICIIHGVVCSLIRQLLLRAKDATFWVGHCEKLFLYKVRWPNPLHSAWFPLACFPLFLHRSILKTSPELQYRAGCEREGWVELVFKRGERRGIWGEEESL